MNIERKIAGFTLIELMITVAVIGILAAIAFPSYEETVRRGKRTEGKNALMDVAARQERYYSDNNTYGSLTNLGLANPYPSPDNGYYNITITAGGSASQTFTLSAAPTFTDTTCGTFTLTNTGVKTSNDNTQCWNR